MNSYPQTRLCRNEGKTNLEATFMRRDESLKLLGAQSSNSIGRRSRWKAL